MTGIVRVQAPAAELSVSLLGGQVLSWRPAHASQPVLWLSEHASFDGSVPIRGGVPICWPWFGAHPQDSMQPAHGIARRREWCLEHVRFDEGVTTLELTLPACSQSLDQSCNGLSLTQKVQFGRDLSISLTSRNIGPSQVRYSEGFHTYFRVSDVLRIAVQGLRGRDYIDLTRGDVLARQAEDIVFDGEVGRMFISDDDRCTIVDRAFRRAISIEKQGSGTTVIWNPGPVVASRMPDLGAQAWQQMVCVETANARERSVVLAPGAEHTTTTRISVAALT